MRLFQFLMAAFTPPHRFRRAGFAPLFLRPVRSASPPFDVLPCAPVNQIPGAAFVLKLTSRLGATAGFRSAPVGQNTSPRFS